MNQILEDIKYPETGIPAKTVYKCMILEDSNFIPILGKNQREICLTDQGYTTIIQSSAFPIFNSNHYLFIEDGKPKGFFAIKEDRLDYVRREVLNIQLVFVDKEHQRQGVAKRMLNRLKKHAEVLDGMCKNRESYSAELINERYFSLSVYPNVFDWQDGKELDLQSFITGDPRYDFTVEIKNEDAIEIKNEDKDGYYPADLHMYDSTYENKKFTKRISAKKLREFYDSLGFIQCPELQFNHPINKGKLNRKLNVTHATFCNMNKTPMIYPNNNSLIEIVKKSITTYWEKPITEEMIKIFTRDVLQNLDNELTREDQLGLGKRAG